MIGCLLAERLLAAADALIPDAGKGAVCYLRVEAPMPLDERNCFAELIGHGKARALT